MRISMRTLKDRIRHVLFFEATALCIVIVIGSWITSHSPEQVGMLGLFFSALAMIWNFTFNWIFDHWDKKYRNFAPRTISIRIIHAALFELVLLIAGIFLVSWWLDTTLWYAFMLDLGMSAFFLIYAFCYNWSYDILFPIPCTT